MPDSESGSESDSDLDEFFKKRRCTDALCCLLFVAAMVGLIVMLVYGTTNGNLRKINHGFDAHGRQCGVNETVEDKPLLYFCPLVTSTGVHQVNMDDPVCVAACPKLDFDNVTLTPSTIDECENSKAYPTTQIGHRYCLPSGSDEAEAREQVKQGMRDAAEDFLYTLSYVGRGWQILLLTVVVATAMGYIFLFLLKTLAKCIIYVCAIVGLVAFVLLGTFLWTQAGVQAAENEHLMTTFKVLAVISWVLAVVVVSLICCCHGAIELSTACMGQAASAIWRMPSLLLLPLVKAFLKCCVYIVLAAGFVHLITIGDVSGVGRTHHWSFTGQQKLMLAAYVLFSYWILAFISALYQFSIAHAVGQYYIARIADGGKKATKCCAVLEGLFVGLRYHGGSLAFGSAIIALLEFIQRILEWAEKKSAVEGNKVVQYIVACLMCCCRCLEGIIQFINKNAYIDIAITSSGFCTAVQNVMHIIIDHGAAMAILNGATFIFQIVGLASITASCGLLSAYLLSDAKYTDSSSDYYIENPGWAIAICCILAFVVAWAFMAIFDMASDTLLICHAEDKGGKHRADNQELADLLEEAQKKAEEMKAANASDSESEDGHRPARRYSR